MPLDKKCEKSNFVIDNSGSIENTQIEVERILKSLNASKQHWKVRGYIFMTLILFVLFIFWLDTIFNFMPFNIFKK